MKALVGLHKSRFDLNQVSAPTGKPEDMNFAQHISDEAITLVRKNGLPFPLLKSVASLPITHTPAGGSETKTIWSQSCWERLSQVLADKN
jgi:hypothetical protein